MDTTTKVLSVVLLVGFILAIVAYKPVRNRVIATKGYDADKGIGNTLAFASIVLPLALSGFELVQDPIIVGACFFIPLILNIVLRISKVGFGNALLLTFLQTAGVIWVVFAKIFSVVARMMDMSFADAEKADARRNADLAKKEELYRQYRASVAEAEANRDEVLTMTGGDIATDSKIAEAEDEYNRKVSEIDRR